MSGNGITFSEYNAGAALPKIMPTATGAGPVEMGMKSTQVGGKRRGRFSKKMKGCGKKGGKSRRRRTSRR